VFSGFIDPGNSTASLDVRVGFQLESKADDLAALEWESGGHGQSVFAQVVQDAAVVLTEIYVHQRVNDLPRAATALTIDGGPIGGHVSEW